VLPCPCFAVPAQGNAAVDRQHGLGHLDQAVFAVADARANSHVKDQAQGAGASAVCWM